MLKNYKVATKLMLILFLPVLGLVVMCAHDVYTKYRTMQNVHQTERLLGLSIRTSALVHELQKERGLSSGYLNSKGTKFREELAAQRGITDDRFRKLADYVAQNREAAEGVRTWLDSAKAQYDRLPSTREKVDTLALEGKDSFLYYTGINYTYLEVVGAVARQTKAPQMMRVATAYFAFTKEKEEMGKERATLNAVLAADRFSAETFERTLEILAGERIYLGEFRRFGTSRALALYDRFAATAEFARSEALRNAVLAKSATGGFGLSPEEWFQAITAKIDLMKRVEDDLNKELLDESAQIEGQAQFDLELSVGIAAVIGLLPLILSTIVIRSITKPLLKLVAMLKDIAQGEGDLTKRLDTVAGKDEIGEISRWFNLFVDNIASVIGQASATTGRVAAASEQLHGTADQIATAAEEVAGQSTTVATASEEMSSTSTDISRNCSRAVEVANHAGRMASDGSVVVQDTLEGMNQIAERVREAAETVKSLGGRSDQIGEIVSTIEEIADQTNLLALNAAIEAARAGEQGRGFAVVADEVRALAERTARATREIGGMIKGIQEDTLGAVNSMDSGVKAVEVGMASSRRSGEALTQILQAVGEVTVQMEQIATAAEEQTATTCEISHNIQQITEVVQETARGASETSAAASSLHAAAQELEKLVSRFKI